MSAIPADLDGPGHRGRLQGLPRQTRDRMAMGLWTAAIFVVHTLSPSVTIGDSRLSSAVAWQLVRHGNLHLEANPAVAALQTRYDLIQHHGHALPYFPWPSMLFALPGDLLVRLTGRSPATLSIADPGRTFLVEIPTASLLVALTAVIIRQLILEDDGPWATRRVASCSALIFAFATSAWSIGSRALWQQTVSMFLIALTLLLYRRVGRGPGYGVLFGVVLALGPICRPTDAILTVLFLALLVGRREVSKEIALGFATPMLAFLAFSSAQYGGLVPPYYVPGRLENPAAYGFLDGLALNLVSPSRGLLIYDPILVLAGFGVWRLHRHRLLTLLHAVLIGAIVLQWLLLAKFGSTGGHVFGPRLFLDVVPLLVLLAVPAVHGVVHRPAMDGAALGSLARAAGAVVLAAGLLVNASGALLRSSRCWNITPTDVDVTSSRIWDWSDAQLLWPWKQLARGASLRDVEEPRCDV